MHSPVPSSVVCVESNFEVSASENVCNKDRFLSCIGECGLIHLYRKGN